MKFSHFQSFASRWSSQTLLLLGTSVFGGFLSLLSSLVIARFFGAYEIGRYSVIISISGVVAMLLTRRQELGIVPAVSNLEAWRLLSWGIRRTVIYSLVPLPILVGMTFFCSQGFWHEGAKLLLLSLFLSLPIAISTFLIQIPLRNGNFFLYGSRSPFLNLVLSGSQFALGRFWPTLASLVLADFIARLFSTIGLVRASLHFKRDLLQSHNVLDLQAKPNIDFVKHIFPASMFDVFTINLLPLLIALAFSYEEAGLYSLTSRIFSLPSTLLAASLGSVLLHRFSRMQNRSPLHVASLYGKILTTLMAIGFFTALTFYVYSDEIVDELLGSKWVQVSDVSRAISFYLGVNVAWAVLNGLFAAFQRWHEYLRVSQLRFALAFISWPICFLFSLSFAQTILVVTLGLGLAQLWGLIWLLGRIRRSP